MKRLAYLLVASVLFGAHFLAIPLGIAQLSAYRFIILLSIVVLVYRLIIRDSDLEFIFGNQNTFSPYQIFYLFWLFYAAISVFWVASLSRWFVGMFFVGCGIFSILFITYYIREEHEVKNLFKIFFVVSIFHQLSAWIESMSVTYPKTTFGNQNDFATMLLAGLFVGMLLFLNTKKVWLKLFIIGYLISGYFLIEITSSRANSLALLVGLSVMLVVKIFDFKLSRTIFYIILGAMVFFLLILLISPAFRDSLGEFMTQLFAGPIRRFGSNRNRINMVLNGFYFLLGSFGLGVGAGNVEHYLVNESILYVDAPNIHNWFMDILVGYGIIVFVLYVIMYVYILRKLFLNYKHSTNTFIKYTSLVLFGYLIAFIISSNSSATNIIIEWQWVFWGIIIAFVQYTEYYESNNILKQVDKRFRGETI